MKKNRPHREICAYKEKKLEDKYSDITNAFMDIMKKLYKVKFVDVEACKEEQKSVK